MERELGLSELKAKAVFQFLHRDGGHRIPLKSWNGVASVGANGHWSFGRYFLTGNRLRVELRGSNDVWYTLS